MLTTAGIEYRCITILAFLFFLFDVVLHKITTQVASGKIFSYAIPSLMVVLSSSLSIAYCVTVKSNTINLCI